jgi:hypothetical protein
MFLSVSDETTGMIITADSALGILTAGTATKFQVIERIISADSAFGTLTQFSEVSSSVNLA